MCEEAVGLGGAAASEEAAVLEESSHSGSSRGDSSFFQGCRLEVVR